MHEFQKRILRVINGHECAFMMLLFNYQLLPGQALFCVIKLQL